MTPPLTTDEIRAHLAMATEGSPTGATPLETARLCRDLLVARAERMCVEEENCHLVALLREALGCLDCWPGQEHRIKTALEPYTAPAPEKGEG